MDPAGTLGPSSAPHPPDTPPLHGASHPRPVRMSSQVRGKQLNSNHGHTKWGMGHGRPVPTVLTSLALLFLEIKGLRACTWQARPGLQGWLWSGGRQALIFFPLPQLCLSLSTHQAPGLPSCTTQTAGGNSSLPSLLARSSEPILRLLGDRGVSRWLLTPLSCPGNSIISSSSRTLETMRIGATALGMMLSSSHITCRHSTPMGTPK